MSTIIYPCGCFLSRSMYGEREVLYVNHCGLHDYLWSQHKSLYQMAQELVDVHGNANGWNVQQNHLFQNPNQLD